MNPYELTEEEEAVCKWQYELYGDFYKALWIAIMRADSRNQARLSLAFPAEVSGYQKYCHESGWWERVQKKWEARAEVEHIKNTTRKMLPLIGDIRTDVGKEYLSHRLKEGY